MKEIIKFTDVDVDGNGLNVETLIQVDGKPLTNGTIDRVKEAIIHLKKRK